MRSLGIELVNEGVEAVLLLQAVVPLLKVRFPENAKRNSFAGYPEVSSNALKDPRYDRPTSRELFDDCLWPVSTVRCDAEKLPESRVKRKFTSRARNDVIDPNRKSQHWTPVKPSPSLS